LYLPGVLRYFELQISMALPVVILDGVTTLFEGLPKGNE